MMAWERYEAAELEKEMRRRAAALERGRRR
jgi:hypothetical protein